MPSASFKDELLAEIRNLRAFAISLSGSVTLADDLVQESLLRAWANSDKFQPGTSLRAWLFTILRNIYYSNYRKRAREVQDSDENRTRHHGTEEGARSATLADERNGSPGEEPFRPLCYRRPSSVTSAADAIAPSHALDGTLGSHGRLCGSSARMPTDRRTSIWAWEEDCCYG
jgi:RNA polymerase sigma factor (sigma-70 family)